MDEACSSAMEQIPGNIHMGITMPMSCLSLTLEFHREKENCRHRVAGRSLLKQNHRMYIDTICET